MVEEGFSDYELQILLLLQDAAQTRKALLEHPDYYSYRQEVLDFLEEYEHGNAPKSPASGGTPKPKAIAAE